jgi:hypothetical protein
LCLSQNTSCPSVTLNGGPFETAKARDSFSAPPQPVHGVCKNPLSSSLWLCVCVCVCDVSIPFCLYSQHWTSYFLVLHP